MTTKVRHNLSLGWGRSEITAWGCVQSGFPFLLCSVVQREKRSPTARVPSVHWASWKRASPRKRTKLHCKRTQFGRRGAIRARAPCAEGWDNSLAPCFAASTLTRDKSPCPSACWSPTCRTGTLCPWQGCELMCKSTQG